MSWRSGACKLGGLFGEKLGGSLETRRVGEQLVRKLEAFKKNKKQKRLLKSFGGFWKPLGAFLGASWEPLGGIFKPPERSGVVLERSWGGLGRSWSDLGVTC